MTITISIYVIYYWIIACLYESISISYGWKKFKKTNKQQHQEIMMLKAVLKQNENPAVQIASQTIFGPLGYITAFILFSLAAPVVFISSLWRLGKKAVGYKSKRELAAEAAWEQQEKERKEHEQLIAETEKDMQERFGPFKPEEDK